MIFTDGKEILGTTGNKVDFNEGTYKAKIVKVVYLKKQKTDNGFRDFLEITYEITVGIVTKSKVEKIMITDYIPSKCMQFLEEIYNGNIPTDTIDISKFVGKKGEVIIKHKQNSNGKVYSSIDSRRFI